MSQSTKSTKDVAVQGFTFEALAGITTFQQAIELATDKHGQLLDSLDLGDGFASKEKSELVGVPMVILEWQNGKNTSYGDFLIVKVVTDKNEKVVFVDGSTGIKQQLDVITENSGRTGGILAREGLRVSEYTYTDDDGKEKPAKTYYIA